MKATIYDVAREANVSIATVSKVINNTGRIGDSTREKVIKVMKQLNYRPSFVASALTGKKTETLGLLVPDISNPFFSEIARMIEDRAYERDKSVIMCSTDYNEDKEKKYIELLQRKQIDGLIVTSGFKNDVLLQQLKESGVPIAVLAQKDMSFNVSSVSVDDYKGGYIGTEHLLTKCHKKIAIIGEKVKSSNMRIQGYKEALGTENISIKKEYVMRTVASIENGRKCAIELLEMEDPPTALFACNDLIAMGAIQGAREKGINVPEKFSIVGFDNTVLATTTFPGLTTVAQPIAEMGKKIVDVLIKEIESDNHQRDHILFAPKLIIRGTTATLEKEDKITKG